MAQGMQESRETIRVPLVQAENNKIEPGLVGPAAQLNAGKREHQYINCYPVFSQSGSTQEREGFVCTRMGFTHQGATYLDPTGILTNTTTTYPKATLGFKSLTDCVITAYYDATANLSYIIQLEPSISSLGSISGLWNIYLSELSINNIPHLGIIFDNGSTSKGYWVASSAGTFAGQTIAEITDVNFPPKATPAMRVMGGMVQLNNRVYVLTADGYIWNTDNNSITSWPTLGFKEVSSSPDQGMALVRYKHHLVAFGSSSVEFFNDEIDGDSPLRRTDQAYINFGLASPNSVISIDDTLYWVAKSAQGAQGLWKLDGYTPMLLSQPFESYWLRGGTNAATQWGNIPSINLQVISMHGMRHIITNLEGKHALGWLPYTQEGSPETPSNQELWGTAVYCIETNTWWWLAYANASALPSTDPPHTIPQRGIQVLVSHNLSTNSQYIHNVGYSGLIPVIVQPSDQTNYYRNAVDWIPTDPLVWDKFWYRIPVGIFSNTLDFGSANRKEVHRATMIMDLPFSYIENYDLGTLAGTYNPYQDEEFYFYLLYTKNDFATTLASQWSIRQTEWLKTYSGADYTTFQRLYWNRLGHGRRWRFGFMTNHMIPLRMKAIELEVTKGTH